MMTRYPFRNLQVMERIAESYVQAGLPGDPSGFYKISAENRLNENELRQLFFGQKVAGINMVSEKQWWIDRNQGGEATIQNGDKFDTGRSWIEDDMLCDQWENIYENLRDCWVVYRNPEGTVKNNDQYLGAPGHGIYPFSLVE